MKRPRGGGGGGGGGGEGADGDGDGDGDGGRQRAARGSDSRSRGRSSQSENVAAPPDRDGPRGARDRGKEDRERSSRRTSGSAHRHDVDRLGRGRERRNHSHSRSRSPPGRDRKRSRKSFSRSKSPDRDRSSFDGGRFRNPSQGSRSRSRSRGKDKGTGSRPEPSPRGSEGRAMRGGRGDRGGGRGGRGRGREWRADDGDIQEGDGRGMEVAGDPGMEGGPRMDQHGPPPLGRQGPPPLGHPAWADPSIWGPPIEFWGPMGPPPPGHPAWWEAMGVPLPPEHPAWAMGPGGMGPGGLGPPESSLPPQHGLPEAAPQAELEQLEQPSDKEAGSAGEPTVNGLPDGLATNGEVTGENEGASAPENATDSAPMEEETNEADGTSPAAAVVPEPTPMLKKLLPLGGLGSYFVLVRKKLPDSVYEAAALARAGGDAEAAGLEWKQERADEDDASEVREGSDEAATAATEYEGKVEDEQIENGDDGDGQGGEEDDGDDDDDDLYGDLFSSTAVPGAMLSEGSALAADAQADESKTGVIAEFSLKGSSARAALEALQMLEGPIYVPIGAIGPAVSGWMGADEDVLEAALGRLN